jgi:DNA-directed RNA polymerase specialized sigma24 family protein
MDVRQAIDQLPDAYAEALRLRDAGLAHLIPKVLDIPPETVDALLRLAEAKLERLMADEALIAEQKNE